MRESEREREREREGERVKEEGRKLNLEFEELLKLPLFVFDSFAQFLLFLSKNKSYFFAT